MTVALINRRNVILGAAAGAVLGRVPAFAAGDLIPVTLAESQGHGWALFYAADAFDLWEKNGLKADISRHTAGRLAMEAVMSSRANFCTATDSPFVLGNLRGHRLIAVADFTRSWDLVVTVRTDRGIEGPGDLKGKTIATQFGTSGHYYLSRYLTAHGLSLTDIKMMNVGGTDMVNALMRGDIDGFAWNVRSGQVAQNQLPDLIKMLSNDGVTSAWSNHRLMVTNTETVENNPEMVHRALRALFDAETAMGKQREEIVDYVADLTKTSKEHTIEDFALSDFTVELGENLIDSMVTNAEWAIEVGISKEPKDDIRTLLREAVRDDFMRAVRPDRVKLA